MKRNLKLALAVLLLLGAVTSLSAPARASSPVTVHGVWLSTYTWWNNSPAGCGIEYAKSYGYPTIDNCAGNSVRNAPGRTGTYASPITYASQDRGVFSYRPGTRIYIPYFAKYFIIEDLCSTCYTSRPQADLWVGGVSRSQEASTSPADIVNLWQRETVIVNPPPGEPVNVTPFYRANPETGLKTGAASSLPAGGCSSS